MKKLILALLFLLSGAIVLGQQTPQAVPSNATIERVDLQGLAETRLSPELRADLQKLVGQTYNPETVNALAQDIQVELPEYVAAATAQPGSQPDRVRVVLVVAKIAENDDLKTNINSRYIIDAVEFEGLKVRISEELKAELDDLVGDNVNSALLNNLRDRIARDNPGMNADVTWKLQRSASAQHVKVVYEVRRAKNNLSFGLTGGSYHSRQGFSIPKLSLNYTHEPIGTFKFWMANNADELIERYAGYGVGYSLGTQPLQSVRIRLDLNYSSYRAQWKTNTLEADQQSIHSPGLYRLRDTLSGFVNFTHPLSPRMLLTADAGVEFTEVQMQTPTTGFQKSNNVRAGIQSSYSRRPGTYSHEWGWAYRISAGTGVLDSDFIYARHEVTGHYTFTDQPHSIQFDFQAGRITGDAPMYERFSIGNARTLRGWNKYEINPLGGNRVVYGSAGYGYKIITGFYDVGSVWDSGERSELRQTVGVRLGKPRCRLTLLVPHPECFSVAVGFPINGGNARPSFILGMGF